MTCPSQLAKQSVIQALIKDIEVTATANKLQLQEVRARTPVKSYQPVQFAAFAAGELVGAAEAVEALELARRGAVAAESRAFAAVPIDELHLSAVQQSAVQQSDVAAAWRE